MEQPESLIPLSLSFAGPQRFFQQDIFPPSQGTLAQPDSKNTGQCLFTLTPENQLIFFLSSRHITISYKCPTKILSHMSCWNAHWVWLRQKDPPQLQPWTPPSVTCDAFLLLPCASGASPFSASQECTMEDWESLRYCQPYQEMQGHLEQTEEIICPVPRCLWKGQGHAATRRGLLVARWSSQQWGWARLDQVPASNISISCAGPEALLQVHSHQDTRPAC